MANEEDSVRVVFVTAPTQELAADLGRQLVEARLCACVNVLAGVQSIYEWEGEVCCEQEALMILKTTQAGLDALHQAVLAAHPYDTPEFLTLKPCQVDDRYGAWLAGQVGS
jgi:periplasmic divalent cation tolerance protein